MRSSFTAGRSIEIARRLAPWLVGPVVLIVRSASLELSPPSACPGLLELISIAAVRIDQSVHVGSFFTVLHAIVIVAALAAFTELARRFTHSLAISVAVALAAGLGPLFSDAIAPPGDAAAFGICAATALAWTRFFEKSDRRKTAAFSIIGALLAAALLVPPWLVPAAVGAGAVAAVTWRTVRRFASWTFGACAGAAFVAATIGILQLSPPRALGAVNTRSAVACVLPPPSAARTVEVLKTFSWWVGPFGFALAVLGAFLVMPRTAWRTRVIVASVAMICLMLAAETMAPAVAAAPSLLLVSLLAASGLREVIDAIGRGARAALAAVLIVVLVPALAASRRVNDERDDWIRPLGHGQQTLRQMTAVLNLVPQEATFVEEDATIDVLLRAAVFGGRRKLKPVTMISPDPDAVAQAIRSHAVYAFPRRQEDLSLRGFIVEPFASSGAIAEDALRTLEGIAAITGRRTCQAVSDRWSAAPGASGRIALSADREGARGPAVIYFGGPTPSQPSPDGWPPRTLRGFRFFTFEQPAGARTERVVEEARDVGLPADHPLLAEPFLLRLTLHRTPRAPLALAVVLGAPFPIGVTKLEAGAANVGRLTLCDAPAVRIVPLPRSN
jgi:hypothetical protein